jgi:transcriptional regulator with XRE-family HTH domain
MSVTYSKNEQIYLTKVGNRIRELRIEIGLSQEKLSFACNLDRTYVGSVERGERNISVINLNKIAIALKTEPFEILKFQL